MSDYNYLNARIRSLAKDLFTKAHFQELLGLDDTPARRQFFLSTAYRVEASEAAEHGSSGHVELERALVKNLHQQCRLLRKWAGEEPGPLIEVLFLRWDLHNIKTLLRAKRSGGLEGSLLDALIPAGEYSPRDLEELAKARDLREAVNLLLTWRAPLRSAIAAYPKVLEDQGALAADFSLDSAYSQTLESLLPAGADENTQLLRHVLSMEVDQKNIRTILKLTRSGQGEQALDYLLDGGRLGSNRLRDLVLARTQEEQLEKLKVTYLAPALQHLVGAQVTLAQIEAALDRFIERESVRSQRENPLSIGVFMAYLARKVREVINLRLILKSSRFGFGRELVEKELAYV